MNENPLLDDTEEPTDEREELEVDDEPPEPEEYRCPSDERLDADRAQARWERGRGL